MIEVKIDDTDDANVSRILYFLCSVDHCFTPKLSSRVDLKAYADKLSRYACNLFAVNENSDDIAHVALYLNNNEGFISSVAVLDKFQGMGLARLMITKAINIAKKRGCKALSLEVGKGNIAAQNLYSSLGFLVVQRGEEANTMTYMKLKL